MSLKTIYSYLIRPLELADLIRPVRSGKDALFRFLSGIWIIGTLFSAGRTTLISAFYEFIYLFLWSVLPFALGALVLYVTSASADKSFYEMGLNTFRNGELLVFTISMLAPILYLTLHDPEQAEPFPHKLPISTVVALIVVTCAALFALLKASAVKDLPFVFDFSIALTLLALAFRYLAIVYHKIRMPPLSERDLREPQDTFVKDFRRHVEGDSTKDGFTRSFESHLKEQS
ncbi:MAG: hypothetical protein Q7T29_07035 [Gallionella sp.]|nr:hypothetical protein [Gallionella sp.]